MKRQGLIGLLAGTLIGAGLGTTLTLKPSYESGLKQGISEGYEKGHNEGLAKCNQIQYVLSNTAGPYFMRDSETGKLKYARFDILFDGQSFDDYLNSRMPPSSVIIMSDLRGIKEIGEDTDKLHGKAYLDMLWRGAVPAVILTSEENEETWKTDDNAQRLVEQYLPPHTKYEIRIVPKEEFQTVDPWQQIEKDTPIKGTYRPSSIEDSTPK